MVDYYTGWLSWEAFIEWFWTLPLAGQIFFVIGVITVLVLIGIGVYYLIKGVVYLVYYILKGVYYLLRAILFGIYKFFEELYYLISSKEKPVKQKNVEVAPTVKPAIQYAPVQRSMDIKVRYCSECGNPLTDSMSQQLSEKGVAFCSHCGKGFKAGFLEMES